MPRAAFLSNTFTTRKTMGDEGNTSKKREPTTPATFATKKLSPTNCEQARKSMRGFRMLSIRPIQRDGPRSIARLKKAHLSAFTVCFKREPIRTCGTTRSGPRSIARPHPWTEPRTVERLLEAGANPHVSNGKDQQTPLHLAVQSDSPESVNHLLEAKASPGVADSEGRTPLHYAAANCSPEITERLLEAGADPSVRDNAGRTPLDVATDRRARLDPSLRNDEAVRLFEKATTPQQDNTPDKGRPMRQKTSTEEYYKQFADDIITQIERGTAPWQKHWAPGENRMPENFSDGCALSRRECVAADGQAHPSCLERSPLGHLQPDQRGRGAGTERRTGHHNPRLQASDAGRRQGINPRRADRRRPQESGC